MPTIAATAHQALRYFFVGAIAVVCVVVAPGEAWSRRVLPFLTWFNDARNPGAVLAVLAVAILILGSLIYGAHRVVVYPVIFRIILWTVSGREGTSWRRFLWPYGTAVVTELQLEELGPRLEKGEQERFVGWASELHVYYLATEIALFTLLVWPRWQVACPLGWALGLGALLLLIGAWDQQSASVLVHLARRKASAKVVPTGAASAPSSGKAGPQGTGHNPLQ